MQGIGASLMINVTGALLAFVLQALLTGVMNTEQYGIYVYVFTWMSVLSMLPRMGLDTCLLRYMTEYRAKGEWHLFLGVLRKTIDIVKISSVSISIIFFLFIMITVKKFSFDLYLTFIIGIISIPFMALSKIYQSAIQSTYHEVLSLVPNILIVPISTYMIIFIIRNIGIEIYSAIAILSYVISLIASCIVMIVVLRRALEKICTNREKAYETQVWLKTAMPVFLMSILYILLNRLDIIIAGWLLGTTSAGLYSVSSLVASTVSFGFLAANTIIAPQISHFYHLQRLNDLQEVVKRAMRIVIFITVPIACLILLFGRLFLSIFGLEFSYYYNILIILTIGQIYLSFTGSPSYVMIVSGYQMLAAKLMFIFVVIDVILNFIFINVYGISGAAYASVLSMAGWNTCMYIFVRKRLHIDTTIISLLK
jgi:O-antigen/teichoic acid export membrane protein